MAEKRECPSCGNMVTVRKDGKLRAHKNKGVVCEGGALVVRRTGESIEAKAARYLAEGRVTILSVSADYIEATVQGSAEEAYEVKFTGHAWVCSCEAQTWRCSHVVAVQMVVGPRFQQLPPSEESQSKLDEEITDLLGGRIVQHRKEDIEV